MFCVCCVMFDYDNSRPTQFFICIFFKGKCFSLLYMVCCISMIVFSVFHFIVLWMLGSVLQMMAVCTHWMVCVYHLKKWLCVPNENRSFILWTGENFWCHSLLEKGVSGLAFCVWGFEFCVAVLRIELSFRKTCVNNCEKLYNHQTWSCQMNIPT